MQDGAVDGAVDGKSSGKCFNQVVWESLGPHNAQSAAFGGFLLGLGADLDSSRLSTAMSRHTMTTFSRDPVQHLPSQFSQECGVSCRPFWRKAALQALQALRQNETETHRDSTTQKPRAVKSRDCFQTSDLNGNVSGSGTVGTGAFVSAKWIKIKD